MFKSFRLLGFSLGIFLFSLFDGGVLVAQYSCGNEYLLEDATLYDEYEGLVSENVIDELYTEYDEREGIAIDELYREYAAQQKQAVDATDIIYILWARPGGTLGAQLDYFWANVNAQKLKNPPVRDYPVAHVSLTGFFKIDNPGDQAQEDRLIFALQMAIDTAPVVIPILINSSITQSKNIDYIRIISPLLHDLTANFLAYADIDSGFIRPKPNAKIKTYHITLRQDTNKSTMAKVQKLEKSTINLAIPSVQNNTPWSLYIYKKTGKKFEIIYQQSIVTQ